MKTAIVYDRVNKWGGAERVLLALHEIFPDAPLFTSVYDAKGAPWAEVFPQVIPSFLQKIPFVNSKHELLAPLMPLAFESLNSDGFDLVISVTSEASKGIITKPDTFHLCYCLTPTRYLWSHYDEYFKGASFKVMTKPIVSYLKTWDKTAAQRPDVYVAISTEVKKRIKKYYNRDSEIIYPPVDIEEFKVAITSQCLRKSRLKNNQTSGISMQSFSEINHTGLSGKGKYYLIVSRLVPYKKVDLAIEAFNDLRLPLVIVGVGSEEKKLRLMASNNIFFAGFVGEGELPIYYKNARAFIMPQEEDFGISAIEAQAFGCPVIAYRKGGSLDTVIEEKTGIFFDEQGKEPLKKAVRQMGKSERQFWVDECVANARRFTKERFKNEIKKLVDGLRKTEK